MPHAPLAPTSAPAARLASALDRAARSWDGQGVLRVEVPAAPADALAWAAAQAAPTGYWRGRDEAEARASTGAALTVEAPSLDAVDPALLRALPPNARLTATARFDPTTEVGEEWRAFGAVRLVLPFMRRDDPDRAEWDRMLRRALAAIEVGTLDKVVLARRARYRFDEPVDAIALLRQLEAATPRCYHALVAPSGTDGPTFLTATPECLLRIDGRQLTTEAVAGTRPRAEGDAADDRLRTELLDSEKDQREHAFVVRAIVDALAPLADAVEADGQAGAMTLARGRHLRTGIRATLADGVGPLDVLRALHPTPAVGGTPTLGALDAIDRLEPFDRGLYAGPVGWIGRDASGALAADLAVGIRSGLADGRSLSLYSGAGIVAGSDPEAEWAEIEHKIGDFARVLGLDAPTA